MVLEFPGVMLMLGRFLRVRVAVADLLGSATLVTVIVATPGVRAPKKRALALS
jgi:hypothetical protein